MLAQTWNYAAPNLDGTCPNPDTQMLIRNTAPGTCILNYHPPIFTRKCMQPDPYTHGRNIGFQKQSNKDYSICAPSCSPSSPCPDVGTDPTSNKKLQGIPVCTAYPTNPGGTHGPPNIGHCVIVSPFEASSIPGQDRKHYNECKSITGDDAQKILCDSRANLLHISPADNYLHIDREACETNYTNFLNTNDYGKTIKQLLLHDNTPWSRDLLDPEKWCSNEPVYPSGTIREGAQASNNNSFCDIKKGPLPATCYDIDCLGLHYTDEFGCRRENCCQWYIADENPSVNTGYFPINKPPPPPPPPSIERYLHAKRHF